MSISPRLLAAAGAQLDKTAGQVVPENLLALKLQYELQKISAEPKGPAPHKATGDSNYSEDERHRAQDKDPKLPAAVAAGEGKSNAGKPAKPPAVNQTVEDITTTAANADHPTKLRMLADLLDEYKLGGSIGAGAGALLGGAGSVGLDKMRGDDVNKGRAAISAGVGGVVGAPLGMLAQKLMKRASLDGYMVKLAGGEPHHTFAPGSGNGTSATDQMTNAVQLANDQPNSDIGNSILGGPVDAQVAAGIKSQGAGPAQPSVLEGLMAVLKKHGVGMGVGAGVGAAAGGALGAAGKHGSKGRAALMAGLGGVAGAGAGLGASALLRR